MTRCAQCVVSSPGASRPTARRGASASAKAGQLCAQRMPSTRTTRAIVGAVIGGHVDNRRWPKSPARLLAPRMARRGANCALHWCRTSEWSPL